MRVGAVAMAGALSLMAPQEARALNCSTVLNANNFVGALNGINNRSQAVPPANCTGNNVLGNGNLSNNAPATAGSVQNNKRLATAMAISMAPTFKTTT